MMYLPTWSLYWENRMMLVFHYLIVNLLVKVGSVAIFKKKNCIVCTKYLKCFMLFDNFLIMFIKCVHFNAASLNSLIAKLLYSFQNV